MPHPAHLQTLCRAHGYVTAADGICCAWALSVVGSFLIPPPLLYQNTVQLLHKLKVRSADGKATLLKIIKNPITRHLPPGCKVYGFSVQGTLYNPMSLACTLPQDKPVVFVLGAMAAGHITVNDHPYIEEMISVSDFPVRGQHACTIHTHTHTWHAPQLCPPCSILQ